MSVVELSGVSAGYGAHTVLRDVTLAVDQGEIVAILGPNGVGKSTLLNVALGWLRPTKGSVSLTGRPLASIGASERGRIVSLVPPVDHIAFEYSILEYVLLGRAPYIGRMQTPAQTDIDQAHEALARVGMNAMAAHGVHETSAGERQLVLLARSLAQDPMILLLDEPSAHLDLANKRRLVELLAREAAAGRTIVLTVHEPEFAAAIADRVVLLRNGALLADGTPESVMTADLLTRAYGVPIAVERAAGRSVFIW